MKRQAMILLPALAAWLAGCNSEPSDGRMIGVLAWDRVELSNEAAEPIRDIPVHEGQRVDAGSLLVQLDTRRAHAALDRTTARRRHAEAVLDELNRGARPEQIAQARATLAGAAASVTETQRELARQQQLAKQHLTSPEQVDKANSAWQRAVADRDAVAQRLAELEHGATAEERRQAEEGLAAARADEQEARLSLERLSIRAPRSGQVDALPFEVGERPPVGATLAVLLVGEAPYARLYVPEPLRGRVAVGSAMRVRVDGRADEYTGRVRSITSDPAFTPFFALSERDRSRLVYLAEVTLLNAADLPAGLPLEARLTKDDQ